MTGVSAPTNERTLDSARVKARIRAEHVRIRAKLDDVETTAKALRTAGDGDTQRLLTAVRGLAELLREHLALEEEILVPLVRVTAGFGDARADDMIRDHVEQRSMLEAILEDLASAASAASAASDEVLVVGALELVKAVRDDIWQEEAHMLGEHIVLGAAS